MARNTGKEWLPGHDTYLTAKWASGLSVQDMADYLGRTELAILYRLERLGCKPRKMDAGFDDVYVKFAEKESKPAVGTGRQIGKMRELGMGFKAGPKAMIAAYGGNLRENMVQALTFRGVPLEWDCGDQYREECSNGDIKGLDALIADDPGPAWRQAPAKAGRWSGKDAIATMESAWRECTKYPKPDLILGGPATAVEISNAMNLAKMREICMNTSNSVGKQFPEMDFAEIEARVSAYAEQRLKDVMEFDPEVLKSNGAAEVIRRAGWVVVGEVGTKAHIDTETFSSFCPPPRARFGNGPWNDGVTYFLNETGLNALNLEKTKMSKKFFETRKQILVNGCVHTEQEIKDNAAAFARMIQTEDTQIKALESITAQTKALKREIEERRANLQEFVTFVDSLEPSDDAKTGA